MPFLLKSVFSSGAVFTRLRIQLVVRSELNKICSTWVKLPIDSPEVPADIDTAATLIFPLERMVIQEWSKWITSEKHESIFGVLAFRCS